MSMIRHLRPARWLAVAGAVVLVGALVPIGAGATVTRSGATGSGSCPSGATCTTATIPWVTVGQTEPCTTDCPTVTAYPTTNLDENHQAVFLQFSNFPSYYSAGAPAVAYVSLCADQGTLGDCLPVYPSSSSAAGLVGSELVAFDNGAAGASIVVAEDPEGDGDQAYPAFLHQPAFFCGSGPGDDPCAIEVTIGNGLLSDGGVPSGQFPFSSENTAVIPITFKPSVAPGCDISSESVATAGAWTVSQLVPALNIVACGNAGTYDFNTEPEQGTDQVASLVQSGLDQFGYTDEPESTPVQTLLKTGHFKLIPVSLSATVMAYLATASQPNGPYNLSQFDMTPDDVGLAITAHDSTYAPFGPYKSGEVFYEGGPMVTSQQDPTLCPLNPPQSGESEYCPLPTTINQVPAGYRFGQVGQSVNVSAYYNEVSSGTNLQLEQWLCQAPTKSVTINNGNGETSTYTPPFSAKAALETPNYQGYDTKKTWPLSHICAQPVDTLAPDQPGTSTPYPIDAGSTPFVLGDGSPVLQAVSVYGRDPYLTTSAPTGPFVSYSATDWSNALDLGLEPASLQNAAGDFVTPSAASLDAAISSASSANPDGSLSFNYNPKDPNPAAYPMPMITYALVPTTPLPAGTASLVSSILDDLLSITSTGGTNGVDLPLGYAPLPANLAKAALADIRIDIVSEKAPTPPPPTTIPTESTTTTSTTVAASSQGGSTTPPTATSSGGTPVPAASEPTTSALGHAANPVAAGSLTNNPSSPISVRSKPEGPLHSLLFGGLGGSWVVPLLIALLAAGLAGGPLLLMLDRRRKRIPTAGK